MAKLLLPLIKRLGHVRAYRQYLTIQHCTNFCMFSSLHVRVITDQNTIHVLKFFVKSGLSLKICVLKTRHCRRIGILFTSSVIHVPVSFLKQLKQYRMGKIQCGLCKTVVWNSNWMYVPLSIFNLTLIQWWEQFQIINKLVRSKFMRLYHLDLLLVHIYVHIAALEWVRFWPNVPDLTHNFLYPNFPGLRCNEFQIY